MLSRAYSLENFPIISTDTKLKSAYEKAIDLQAAGISFVLPKTSLNIVPWWFDARIVKNKKDLGILTVIADVLERNAYEAKLQITGGSGEHIAAFDLVNKIVHAAFNVTSTDGQTVEDSFAGWLENLRIETN